MGLDSFNGRTLKNGISASDAALFQKYYGSQNLTRTMPKYAGPGLQGDDLTSFNRAADAIKNSGNNNTLYNGEDVFATQEDQANYKSQQADQKAQDLQAATQKNADKLSSQAKDFRGNLSNYIDQQTDPLIDQSKRNLVNDIQNVKQNSNARGLLFSGVNEGNQASARGFESSQLAKGIQGVNQQANSQADYRDQLAANAQTGAQGQDVALSQYQATQAQTAYEQALQKQASENSFWGSIFGGLASAGGMVAAGALTGGAAPVLGAAKKVAKI